MLAAHGLGAATGLPGAAPAGSAGPLRVAGAAGAAARSGRGGPAGAAAGPDDLAAAQRPGAGFMASGPGTAAALGSVPLVPGPAMAAEPVLAGAAARAQRAEGAGTGAPDPLPPGGLPMAAADGLATPAAGSTGAVPVAGLDLPTGPANMASPAGAGFTAGLAAGAAAGLATPAGLPGTEPAAAAARDGGPAGATGLPQAMGVGPAPAPGQAVGARPVAEARVAVPLTDPGFASALGAQVSLLARGGVHEARLQLHPAEMGPIAVQISLDGVTARVHFQADLATTREVIEASLPALAGALRESGLTLTGGGVSQQTQQQGQQQGQPQGQPGQQPGRAPGADTADGLGRAADAAAAHRGHPGQPRGLVDLVA